MLIDLIISENLKFSYYKKANLGTLQLRLYLIFIVTFQRQIV